MPSLSASRLNEYRAQTFRLRADLKLHSPVDAVEFVNERGFIYFWPIKDITLPNLWTAVAGDRPVANAHDDPGHVTWGWKDQSLDKRWWYYAKILRGRATLISLEIAPYLYALSDNYGEPELDFLDQYHDGLLSHEAKRIYEALLEQGPLDTVNLRRKIRMTSKASNSPFDRALTHLQRDFKILPVGVAQTGAWRYSFIYECVHRWYPDLPALARPIPRSQARARLVDLYFRSVGAATLRHVRILFQWPNQDIEQTLTRLIDDDIVRDNYTVEGESGPWYVLKELATLP